MRRTKIWGMSLVMIALIGAGCEKKPEPSKVNDKKIDTHSEPHAHGAGPNGGVVFDLGKYHAEFTVDHPAKSCMVLFVTDDKKDAKPLPVAATEFTLTTKPTKTKSGAPVPAMTMKLTPKDAKDGKATTFIGTDPSLGNVADFEGIVIGKIDDKPSQGQFKEEEHEEKQAHGSTETGGSAARIAAKEAEVYRKPGGIYTAADIRANGDTTVSMKYRNLKVSHDIKPKMGDKICPVTLTKANPNLKWVIAGNTYEFCCPPCVEEFVETAKTHPDDVKSPETYIKK